jgi:hypothetical protein
LIVHVDTDTTKKKKDTVIEFTNIHREEVGVLQHYIHQVLIKAMEQDVLQEQATGPEIARDDDDDDVPKRCEPPQNGTKKYVVTGGDDEEDDSVEEDEWVEEEEDEDEEDYDEDEDLQDDGASTDSDE